MTKIIQSGRFVPLILLVSFVQGGILMGVELLGAKLLAPQFGTSLYIWASTLGTTLISLAIGYYLGGIMSRNYRLISILIFNLSLAAVLIAVMPSLSDLVFSLTQSLDVQWGSTLSLILYMALPLVLLSTTTPVIIQLLNTDVKTTGRISGSIYALSTSGGILFTFLCGLYFIPWIGIRTTALFLGLLLIIVVMVFRFLLRNHPSRSVSKVKSANDFNIQQPSSFRPNSIFLSIPFLLIISYIEGTSLMIVEIVGAKILGLYYGSSIIIWTCILGVTLLSLSIGYYFGGFISKKRAPLNTLYGVLLLAGFFTAAGPVIGMDIMSFFKDYGVVAGSILSSLIIVTPQIICFGMISPLIIQSINSDVQSSGQSAGRIFSMSTIGGICGTFLAGFWLIPQLGLLNSSFLVTSVLVGIGLSQFIYHRKMVPILLTVIGVLGILILIPEKKQSSTHNILYDKSGILGKWTVMDVILEYYPEVDDYKIQRNLLLNGIDQTKTQLGYQPLSMWSYTHKIGALASIKAEGSSALLFGMGGGSIVHELAGLGFNTDVVELDANLIPIAIDFFNYDVNQSNIYIDDARHYINTCTKKYDVVIFDILQGESQPSHVFTVESFERLKQIMNDDALVIINFQGSLTEPSLAKGPLSLFRTLESSDFEVEYYCSDSESDGFDTSQDIFFIATTEEMNYRLLLEYPRYNDWFEYDNYHYEDLISDEPLNTSGVEILVDDKPNFELINSKNTFLWRKGKIEENLETLLDNGVSIY